MAAGMRLRLGLATTPLLLAGCAQQPVFSVPPQRTAQEFRVQDLFRAGAPTQPPGIRLVSGIRPTGIGLDWTWTTDHAALRLALDPQSNARWDLDAKITCAGVVLDKTGPQHLTFVVNGETVGKATLDAARIWNLRFPVDPARLRAAGSGEGVLVEILIDRTLPDAGGPPFGVLLHEIGFTHELSGADQKHGAAQ